MLRAPPERKCSPLQSLHSTPEAEQRGIIQSQGQLDMPYPKAWDEKWLEFSQLSEYKHPHFETPQR